MRQSMLRPLVLRRPHFAACSILVHVFVDHLFANTDAFTHQRQYHFPEKEDMLSLRITHSPLRAQSLGEELHRYFMHTHAHTHTRETFREGRL